MTIKRGSYATLSLFIFVIVLYTFSKLIGVESRFAAQMILKIRYPKLIAIIIAGALVGVSSLIFQTIVNNRIITPSMLGFDSVYIGIQTVIVFLFGNISFFMNPVYNFFISVIFMILITLLLYRIVLRKTKNNIIILLLIGLVITTLINNGVSFLQSLMSSDEFYTVASAANITLANMNLNIIALTTPIMVTLFILFVRDAMTYEIMSLGQDVSINLGINYVREVNKSLIFIAIAMSVATALVGPLSFLGLIAVNITREFFKTNNYRVLIINSALISVIFLLVGVLLLELIGNITTLPVVINLIGGIYLFYLIIKENRT